MAVLCCTVLLLATIFDRFYSVLISHNSFNTIRQTKIVVGSIAICICVQFIILLLMMKVDDSDHSGKIKLMFLIVQWVALLFLQFIILFYD